MGSCQGSRPSAALPNRKGNSSSPDHFPFTLARHPHPLSCDPKPRGVGGESHVRRDGHPQNPMMGTREEACHLLASPIPRLLSREPAPPSDGSGRPQCPGLEHPRARRRLRGHPNEKMLGGLRDLSQVSGRPGQGTRAPPRCSPAPSGPQGIPGKRRGGWGWGWSRRWGPEARKPLRQGGRCPVDLNHLFLCEILLHRRKPPLRKEKIWETTLHPASP